jgi:hypothetical protein
MDALVAYGVFLLALCGIAYAVTATIRRAWHPEQRPPPPEYPPIPWRRWVIAVLVLGAVIAVSAWLGD